MVFLCLKVNFFSIPDVFYVVQKVETMLEERYSASSSTIAIQVRLIQPVFVLDFCRRRSEFLRKKKMDLFCCIRMDMMQVRRSNMCMSICFHENPRISRETTCTRNWKAMTKVKTDGHVLPMKWPKKLGNIAN